MLQIQGYTKVDDRYLVTTPETTLLAAFSILGTNWKCFLTIWKEAKELSDNDGDLFKIVDDKRGNQDLRQDWSNQLHGWIVCSTRKFDPVAGKIFAHANTPPVYNWNAIR